MIRLFVDVDDTLILYDTEGEVHPYGFVRGTPYRFNAPLIAFVKEFRAKHPDALIVIWSGGGAQYARHAAESVGIDHLDLICCIKDSTTFYLVGEDDIVVDDQELKVPAKVRHPSEFSEYDENTDDAFRRIAALAEGIVEEEGMVRFHNTINAGRKEAEVFTLERELEEERERYNRAIVKEYGDREELEIEGDQTFDTTLRIQEERLVPVGELQRDSYILNGLRTRKCLLSDMLGESDCTDFWKRKELYCAPCYLRATYLTPEMLEGIREGVQAAKEGRVTPWSEVEAELDAHDD